MKKIALLFCAALLIVGCSEQPKVPQSKWEKLWDNDGEYYIDKSSIKGKSIKKAWLKHVEKDGDRSLTLFSVNCAEDTIAAIANYSYDKNNKAKLGGGENEKPRYTAIIPDTNGREIANYLCSQ